MNLSGEDLVPERNHVFHLEIPKDWKTPDVGKFWKSIFFFNSFQFDLLLNGFSLPLSPFYSLSYNLNLSKRFHRCQST